MKKSQGARAQGKFPVAALNDKTTTGALHTTVDSPYLCQVCHAHATRVTRCKASRVFFPCLSHFPTAGKHLDPQLDGREAWFAVCLLRDRHGWHTSPCPARIMFYPCVCCLLLYTTCLFPYVCFFFIMTSYFKVWLASGKGI